MKKCPLLILLTLFITLFATAQNTSPFWSLAGNNNAAAGSKLGTTNAVPLNLTTNNLTRLRINTDGKVGIGTATPATLFHVSGVGAFGSSATAANSPRALNLADANAVMRILRVHPTNAPAVELISRTTADGPNVAYWDLYAEPSDKSFSIRDRVGGGSGFPRLTISSPNGYVGIGTTAPEFLLDVSGRMRLRGGGAGSNTAGLWLNNVNNTALTGFMGVNNDNHLGFYGAGYGWLLLANTTNGNVGIGTTTPAYPLHVTSASAWKVVNGISTIQGNVDRIGVYGEALNNPGWGIGVSGSGGYIGVQGSVDFNGSYGYGV